MPLGGEHVVFTMPHILLQSGLSEYGVLGLTRVRKPPST
jgi:hypothetical protein